MNKRPRSVTVISWIFIAFGGIALLAGMMPPFDAATTQQITEPKAQPLFEHVPILVTRILAVLGGAFMLYGFNWARWLLVGWMGFHVVVGVLHSPFGSLVHGLLFALVVYFLFRQSAAAYFRGTRAEPPGISKTDDTPVA